MKVVVYNKDDFEWAKNNAADVKEKCALLLQPEWSKSDIVMPWITEHTKTNPLWRISLQTHKYLNVR